MKAIVVYSYQVHDSPRFALSWSSVMDIQNLNRSTELTMRLCRARSSISGANSWPMIWSALRTNAIYYCLTKSSRKPIIFYGLSDKYRFDHYHSSTPYCYQQTFDINFFCFKSFLITRQKIRKLVELLFANLGKELSNFKETLGTKSIHRYRQNSLFG